MARTTLDIDDPILEEVKRVRDREGKSIGRVVSDLPAGAGTGQKEGVQNDTDFRRFKSLRVKNPFGAVFGQEP
jgi:hypothetical protein